MTRPADCVWFPTVPRLLSSLFVLAATLSVPVVVRAQDTGDNPPAHISLIEGSVVLERDGRTEPAPSSMPLLAGDRLRTQTGRVEVLYGDGSTLHLDSNTLLDFQSDEVIRLLNGRIRLNIPGADRTVGYRVDAPSAWVQIRRPGEYRIFVAPDRGGEVELAVLRGSAELVNEDGTTQLRAGERAFASAGAAPSAPYIVNSAAWDEFDRWSESRRDQRLGLSSQYLPATVRAYSSTFDSYGSWQYEPVYGYVWYPRVSVGWRPYYHGRWSHYRPWGWTWIGWDPWAWPTHHYGRWGFSSGLWFWIPGRTWGPAWVSWAYAPGYVSWCPLGWNNLPVFSFVHANIYGGRHYAPWHAWTVVPHRSFAAHSVNVGLHVVNARGLDVRTRQAFIPRERGPEYRGYAVPRAATPIRVAGTGHVAVPRGSGVGLGSTATASEGVERGSANFRSRGSAGGQLSGPGFPAPSRVPRASDPVTPAQTTGAMDRASGAPAASVDRRAVPRGSSGEPTTEGRQPPPGVGRSAPSATPSAPGGERRAVPRGSRGEAVPSGAQPSSSGATERSAPAASPPAAGVERRAIPRRSGGAEANIAPRTEPSRRAVPSPERAPSTYRGQDQASPWSAQPSLPQYRAAPRHEGFAQPTISSPQPGGDSRSAQPGAWRSPGWAQPRSAEPTRMPSYRANPGFERGAPAASPPAAGSPPSGGAPPSRGGGATPRSGGGESRGTAVSRGGRGR